MLGFPEAFIPGYPICIWHRSPSSNAQFINEYVINSLIKESPEMEKGQFMAFEGATFVLICTQVLAAGNKDKTKSTEGPVVEATGGGFSMIYGPDGALLVESLSPDEEGILCADIDLSTIDLAKQLIDVVGHYS